MEVLLQRDFQNMFALPSIKYQNSLLHIGAWNYLGNIIGDWSELVLCTWANYALTDLTL
jgi:hypothetical protein